MSFTNKSFAANRSQYTAISIINKQKFPILKRTAILRTATLFSLLIVLFTSCTKELTPIGLGLLEPVDLLKLGYTDTVQIRAYSIPEDSVYTRNLSYAQIGSMYDPIFGKTSASLYSQIFITTSRLRFGTNPVFDSAFLYLPYKSSYGDTLSNMTLRIYRLTEDIIDSLHSYSNTKLNYDISNPLGEMTFQPKPHDSAYYNGSTQAPMLRIPINSTFGNFIMSAEDTTSLNNNVEFVKFFKGVCIVAEPQNTPGKGCILNFSLPSDYSRIQMYYHNTEDTLNYSFSFASGCSRFQNYDHNGFAEAIPILKQQMEGNKELGQDFLFAQGLAGSKIKIEFPYLSKWFENEKIIVNDAQLIFGNGSVSDVFTNPNAITLRGVGEAGTSSPYSIIDETDDATAFDGTYNSNSNTYRFRLTRYIQQVLTGKANSNGLHLIIPSASYVGSRLVLNGTASPQSDLKLYIRYTKLQ
jgi:hypothetical protein